MLWVQGAAQVPWQEMRTSAYEPRAVSLLGKAQIFLLKYRFYIGAFTPLQKYAHRCRRLGAHPGAGF
jgi:hypothetical protein